MKDVALNYIWNTNSRTSEKYWTKLFFKWRYLTGSFFNFTISMTADMLSVTDILMDRHILLRHGSNSVEHSIGQVTAITKTRLFKYTDNFTSKSWKFWDKKNSVIFHISAQNIDCGYSLEPPRRGGSNEYPLSMSLSRNKKNNVYPCKPQFYYIKVGFKGVKII